MTLADDIARWTWHRGRFAADEELEEITLATNAVREVVGDRPLG